jgi:hypothetical protein
VKRVAGNSAAILSASSSPEPSANVRSKEPLYSSHSQLFSLDKLSFLAALSESPNPVKIISDCSARKAAFSPYSNDLALARVDYLYSFIHEVMDDVTQKRFDGLSRQPRIILACWRALRGKTLDNTGLGIMRPARRFLNAPCFIDLIKARVTIRLQCAGKVAQVGARMFALAIW